MTFFFSFRSIDIEKTFQVPPVVANGEMVEVQLREEGEILDPSVFLDGFAQQWKQDHCSLRETEPFRYPSPPPRGSTEICTLTLCIRTILYKRSRPTLSTVIGSTTSAPSKIVLSAVVWTM